MIPKKIYIPVVASIISILAITDFMSIVFDNYFLRDHIDKNFTKYILLFFIPIFEVGYAKKFAIEIVGWVASVVIFIFLLIKIMHWFDMNFYALFALSILLLIFIKIHIDHKKIRYLHLLFQLFFFTRIIIILSTPNVVLWWIDQCICFAILIASIVYFSRYIKNRSIEE